MFKVKLVTYFSEGRSSLFINRKTSWATFFHLRCTQRVIKILNFQNSCCFVSVLVDLRPLLVLVTNIFKGLTLFGQVTFTGAFSGVFEILREIVYDEALIGKLSFILFPSLHCHGKEELYRKNFIKTLVRSSAIILIFHLEISVHSRGTLCIVILRY